MKQIKLTMLTAFALFTFSCSTEDVNLPIEANNANELNGTRSSVSGVIGNNNHTRIDVVVEWEDGTTIRQKQIIRGNYMLLHRLVSWQYCDAFPNREIWTFDATPSNNPQVADPADDDDVKTALVGSNCNVF